MDVLTEQHAPASEAITILAGGVHSSANLREVLVDLKLRPRPGLDPARDQLTQRIERSVILTKKSRIESARDIVDRVKKEMQEPRMTESVRNGLRGLGLRVAKTNAANSARA